MVQEGCDIGAISLLVALDNEREMRGREVLLVVFICLHEVSEETCFLELNLCICKFDASVIRLVELAPLILSWLNVYA